MRAGASVVGFSIVLTALLCGCGGASGTSKPVTPQTQVAAPTFSLIPAQAGAQIVTLSTTTSGATIYYTLDGSTPSPASPVYLAPFLVASNLTVNAYATASEDKDSAVTSKNFTPNIASGTLVWSDEFTNTTGSNQQPDPTIWGYDTGNSGFGNQELENYCSWGASSAPCSIASPNAYVGADNALHIVARQPSAGVYTSARLKSQGLFSFEYGRVEARMQLPESQGLWPAFWLLGNSIATVNWPACGELDVMEHIDASNPENEGYDWVQGSIHGTGLNGGIQYHPAGFSATAWHTYGMIWTKGEIQYYVDSPSNIYASFPASSQTGTWPFDSGPQFLLLNLAVGGDWPGSPDSTTVFPNSVLVDYVRIYTN
jgi:beta-glucanase (GH16 family)